MLKRVKAEYFHACAKRQVNFKSWHGMQASWSSNNDVILSIFFISMTEICNSWSLELCTSNSFLLHLLVFCTIFQAITVVFKLKICGCYDVREVWRCYNVREQVLGTSTQSYIFKTGVNLHGSQQSNMPSAAKYTSQELVLL